MNNILRKISAFLLIALVVTSMASCEISNIEEITGDVGGDVGDSIVDTKVPEQSTAAETNEPTPETTAVKQPSVTETKAPETEAPSEPKTTVAEKLCFEHGGIKVTAKEIVYDSFLGAGLKLHIENTSDKDYTVSVETAIVNNCMISEYFSCTVAAGKKANDTLYLSSTDLKNAGIDNIGQIEIYFYIYDPTTYNRVYETECIIIKTSEYDVMDITVEDAGHVLYEGNDVRIVGKYVEQYGWLGKSIVPYIENNRDENVIVSCEDLSVNGYMVSGWLHETVYSGKYAIADINISNNDLEENDIDKIEEFELKFEVYNPNTYDTIVLTDALAFRVE